MKKTVAITLLCAGSALVAGCNRGAPSGQVAATVDGKEVTLQELNTELQAANVPPTADKQTVQRALLQRVIERKLLVKAAEDKGLDKTPDYLAQKRRADELLLVQAYAKQQLNAVAVAQPADIDKFMAENSQAFANRQQLILDQIRFPTPADASRLKALESAHSMDEVAAKLTELGIKFERGDAGLDTANVPPPLLKQINAISATEPFVLPQPGVVTVNVVKARRPVPVDLAQVRPVAANAWRQRKFGQALEQQVQQLKANAKITYQNGFGPPAPAKGAAGAPAKPAS